MEGGPDSWNQAVEARVAICVHASAVLCGMCVTWVDRLTRTRDFCVPVKRLARLHPTIQQYNVHDTPDGDFVGWREEAEQRQQEEEEEEEQKPAGETRENRRGGFRADTEISPILEGCFATPLPRLCACACTCPLCVAMREEEGEGHRFLNPKLLYLAYATFTPRFFSLFLFFTIYRSQPYVPWKSFHFI